ncbi:hypothetical protein NVIE_021830 [Nitrososphaera viennensis EN76]|uniref:Uncharacterized protein n=1 Tax=Nitrososphaera viennensis EN76 TaxID=926571 RepID=A0A060HLW0_9ARCH|nr:hypothetical protein NVIE_021830 [Nitrososphaera viennensis EN76]
MPTLTISAVNLPSPIRVQTWLEDWQTSAGGVWNQPNWSANPYKITVTGLTVTQVENTVSPTLDAYNEQVGAGKEHLSYSVA